MTEIKKTDKTNFGLYSLDDFIRFQNVTFVYRLNSGGFIKQYAPFTEDWTPVRRREKAAEICGGRFITYCAFDNDRVIGEIMLIPELNAGRMIVDSFHVSGDYRRRGIGRLLFNAAKCEATKRHAVSLYISACSSVETIDFYMAMGCRLSGSPIEFYVKDEPCDIQLECEL